MTVQEGRVSKNKAHQISQSRRVSAVQKIQKKLPLVERTNALNITEFISTYISPRILSTGSDPSDPQDDSGSIKPRNELDIPKYNTSLDIYSASTIPPTDLEACLDLIELTSGAAYAASGIGWSRPKKRKEMQLPDMKYLILRGAVGSSAVGTDAERGDGPTEDIVKSRSGDDDHKNKTNDKIGDATEADGGVLGFLSFMVTYEDGKEVIYCYEIHLSLAVRGQGFGALLMGRMDDIGKLVGLEKAMLTVFRSNVAACRFYEKLGYEVDECSPRPRKLRNGTIKEYDYLILSKRLK
ncbi:Acyl-CoA N-acyltransferase [Penicillium malachiteum]|uniref:N-alpha-acetyltransferase 40 n=1 Tax=Penicillium malachiteum TaxID=1324776 RepID=A0AAD6HTC6_9EURO|nr:Acyl-CoA N-acyltransferase [Penicillium malachiteum]